MFRSISNRIEKVKKNLAQTNQANDKLNRAFNRFLDACFPEGKNFKYQVSYNAANNRIVIETPNKTIANELILKTSVLSRFLLEEKITAQQIIIR